MVENLPLELLELDDKANEIANLLSLPPDILVSFVSLLIKQLTYRSQIRSHKASASCVRHAMH